MATGGGPYPNSEGLVFGIDTGNPAFSNNINTRYYRGRPTTNELSGVGMGTYNNVGGSVTSVLESTSETYQGAPVIRQTLTPLDANGVSWLSGGNNPGIGVVTGGGGGNGGVFTGHSIFFKPTVPMHGAPIYTHYSNIGGWQTCCNFESMGDGWFRAFVIWYDTVTRSDGKYWAINPRQATQNQPIVIFWAGPFKEALNVSYVTPYINTSRSATRSLIDVKRNVNLDVSNISFDGNGIPTFNGVNNFINIPSSSVFDTQTVTVEVIVRPNGLSQNGFWFEKGTVNTQYSLFMEGSSIVWRQAGNSQYTATNTMTNNGWNHVVATFRTGDRRTYVNGTLRTQDSLSYVLNVNRGNQFIGSYNSNGYFYNGQIAVVRVYNRVLSQTEVSDNFNTYKNRFGI